MRGLGISNLVTISNSEYLASLQVSSSLVSNIIEQQPTYSFEVYESQLQAKSKIRGQELSENRELFNKVFSSLQPHLQEAVILAKEKGASSWLTAVPIQEHGFALHKSAFRDAVTLQYGWDPNRLPSFCACGSNFSVNHAFSCNKGGFPSLLRNEI